MHAHQLHVCRSHGHREHTCSCVAHPVGTMPTKKGAAGSAEEIEILDVKGVAEEWDASEDIREKLRDGRPLCDPDGRDSVQECCGVVSILIPVLTRMAVMNTKPLPPIDDLRAEVENLMAKNKRGESAEITKEIVQCSWRVKKLLGFVKMKTRREEVSTVT